MITLSTAAKFILIGQSLYLANPGPVITKSPVLAVRSMPAAIDANKAARVEGWYQVQVINFGSPSWVNVTPEMICVR